MDWLSWLEDPQKGPLLDICPDWGERGPEYRVLYIPQSLLIPLWEKLFDRKISAEDTHNYTHLWELNGYFEKVWSKKAHKILDNLEKKNRYEIIEYRKNLLKFINAIKEGLASWEKECFRLNIEAGDTREDVRKKIDGKHRDISEAIRMEGVWYILSDNRDYRKYAKSRKAENNIKIAQIDDMIHTALKSLSEGDKFLDELLANRRQKVTKTTKDKIKKIL